MRQYTTPEQTAKLIELGFEKPTMKNVPTPEGEVNEEWYSIGELIEMLPETITIDSYTHIRMMAINEVYYAWDFGVYYSIYKMHDDLIDNLFDACVKLKEEGII